VSLPLAQAGYAVIAVGPAYALDLEPDVDDLQRLITMARDGTLPRADGTRIGALGGSYSGLHVFRLAARDPEAIQAALLLGPPTDAFDLRRRFEAGSFHPPFGLDQVLIALGLPDRAPERYWRYSARYHARDIRSRCCWRIQSRRSGAVRTVGIVGARIDTFGQAARATDLGRLDHFYLLAPERTPAIDALFMTTLEFFETQLAVRPDNALCKLVTRHLSLVTGGIYATDRTTTRRPSAARRAADVGTLFDARGSVPNMSARCRCVRHGCRRCRCDAGDLEHRHRGFAV
jgi:pimeloyl-ACP methyl ester carboxylesterase